MALHSPGGGSGGGGGSGSWSITGNSGTTAGTNFLGTTDNVDVSIKRNNVEVIRIDDESRVGIQTDTPQNPLHINATVGATINSVVTASVTVANTTTETTVTSTGQGTLTLPANFFTVGKTIEYEQLAVAEFGYRTNHYFAVTSLSPDTLYAYEVVVVGADGYMERMQGFFQTKSQLSIPSIAKPLLGKPDMIHLEITDGVLSGTWRNPAQNDLKLNILLEQPYTSLKIDLLDQNGRLLEGIGFREMEKGKHSTQFDISNQPPGLYLVRMTSPYGTTGTTIVKH